MYFVDLLLRVRCFKVPPAGWLGTVLCALIVGFGVPTAALTAVAKEAPRLAQCSWDQPGHNPFMGDVVAAVDRYTDIPLATRTRLKQRMAKRNYDDIASIRRDSIEGKSRYEAKIRDMHFGVGRVCATVSRQAWLPSHQERGLVYCEGRECIIVPTVCRNVSRIKLDPTGVLVSRDLLAPDAPSPADALLFDPPSAGAPAQGSSGGPGGGVPSIPGGGDPSIPGGGDPSVPDGIPGGPDKRVRPSGKPGTPEGPPSYPPGIIIPSITPVPEPQTGWLLLMGLVAVAADLLRRRSARG